MKRVMIIGNAGSGKSTLSRKLGELTGLPVVHGDHFQWMKTRLAQQLQFSDVGKAVQLEDKARI